MKFSINLLLVLFIFFSLGVYAQQVKIGGNIRNIKSGTLLELEDNSKALVLPRIATPSSIGTNSYRGMLVYDSTKNLLSFYNGTTWLYPLVDSSYFRNLYNVNGSLMANRRVDLGGFGLSFKTGTDSLYLKGGKVGVSIVPISALHVKGAVRADSVVLASEKLYKVFNPSRDSIVIIDSIGRGRKVGSEDLRITEISNVLELQYFQTSGVSNTWVVPNVVIGNELSHQGIVAVFGNLTCGVRSNYILSKDSVTIRLDAYVTTLGSRAGIIGLRVLQYADTLGTLLRTDTLVTLAKGNTLATGLVASKWNNDLAYKTTLNSATRAIKVEYYVNANNVANGNGFRRMSVVSYRNRSTPPFVNGGNRFATKTQLGASTANAFSFITNNTNRMYIAQGGNVSIGNTSPSYKLDVIGDVRASGTIYTTGVQGTSDIRFKKDISPIQDALSKVMQLQGVTYKWRKEMEKQSGYTFREGNDYGLIAQELQKVLPELVEKDKKGFFTVDYPHIVAILVEAIREEAKQVDMLTAQLQKIEKLTAQVQEIDRLNAQLKELEQLKRQLSLLKAQMQKK